MWLKAEIVERQAMRVWCSVCSKHTDRLRGFRNFSDAFVKGISGSSLKKDAITKHVATSAHLRAEVLEKGPLPVIDIFGKTAIGQ